MTEFTFDNKQHATVLTLQAPDGRQANIDFGGEAVTFHGHIEIDESARLFFNAVFKLLIEERKAIAAEREALERARNDAAA